MMTKKLGILLLLCLGVSFSYAQKKKNLSLDPSKVEWFKDAKFGMFIHWGLYSVLEGTYNNVTMPDYSTEIGRSWYAEWIQARLAIPNSIYHKLTEEFNPEKFDADQWIKEAKNAGMKYFVITAKHHDGFALWDTKYSDFNIANTPYGKDLLQPLVDACKKYGLKYGFYYSHWQDWEHPGGATPYWTPTRDDNEFEKYWQEKSLPQVKELIQKYDPDLLWFDTWDEVNHISDRRRDELIALIRDNSSKCLINGRINFMNPGDDIDFLEMHDNAYPDKLLDKPWQTPATMQHSWAYHAKDYNWKSAKTMLSFLVNNISKGGNYLLNVGPKGDGSFPVMANRRLREMGAWIYANNEAIYDTHRVEMNTPDNVYITARETAEGQDLYLFITESMPQVKLAGVFDVDACEVLETNMPIEFKTTTDGVELALPEMLFDDNSIRVLKLSLKK